MSSHLRRCSTGRDRWAFSHVLSRNSRKSNQMQIQCQERNWHFNDGYAVLRLVFWFGRFGTSSAPPTIDVLFSSCYLLSPGILRCPPVHKVEANVTLTAPAWNTTDRKHFPRVDRLMNRLPIGWQIIWSHKICHFDNIIGQGKVACSVSILLGVIYIFVSKC